MSREIVTQTTLDFIIGIIAILLLLCAGGCNSIKGGATERLDHALDISVDQDGVVSIRDTRNRVASTQPSATGWWNSTPRIGQAPEGGMGEISFDAATKSLKNVWPLVLMFLAGAIALWFLGERLASIVCAALAIVTLLYPLWTALGAAGLVIYAAWSQRKRLKQIIIGNEVAMEVVPPRKAKEMKLLMESKQDEATKAMVQTVSHSAEAKAAVQEVSRLSTTSTVSTRSTDSVGSTGATGARGPAGPRGATGSSGGDGGSGGEPTVVTVEGGEPSPEVIVKDQ